MHTGNGLGARLKNMPVFSAFSFVHPPSASGFFAALFALFLCAQLQAGTTPLLADTGKIISKIKLKTGKTVSGSIIGGIIVSAAGLNKTDSSKMNTYAYYFISGTCIRSIDEKGILLDTTDTQYRSVVAITASKTPDEGAFINYGMNKLIANAKKSMDFLKDGTIIAFGTPPLDELITDKITGTFSYGNKESSNMILQVNTGTTVVSIPLNTIVPAKKLPPAAKPVVKKSGTNANPVIDPKYSHSTQFKYDDAGNLTGAVTTITVMVSDPNNDPLTYNWKSTTGIISSETNIATWTRIISMGQPAGGEVNLTVSDSKGGTAVRTFIFD